MNDCNHNSFSKLIVDAGATKIEWLSICRNTSQTISYKTTGINALLADSETIESTLSDVKRNLGEAADGGAVFYYGAGCVTPEIRQKLSTAIARTWPRIRVEVESDLLGAARALFRNSPGIACIMGTGSNSCFYDGKQIAGNVPSLGFILGDEGSGASLGKRFVKDIYRNNVPDSIRKDFDEEFDIPLGELLERVYRLPAPNRFLATFVPFLHKHIDNQYIRSLVTREFSDFFKFNIALYENSRELPIRFIGSVAFHFESLLREAAESQGFSIDLISKGPMQGLIDFHNN